MKDADFVIDEIVAAQDADPFDDEATTDALTDALNLIVEQRKQIGVLERALEHTPKPVTLLDVFGDGYERIVRCKDCEHATMTTDGKMCKYCEMDTDDFGNQRDVYHDADWFCADGIRKKE